MLSQEIIVDEDFNNLSLGAQNIFVRMLSVSDDYGVVPANTYTLEKLINPPKGVRLESSLAEIVAAKLGQIFDFEGKPFFIFKRDRFDDLQSYLINKRTKSEYLRLTKDFMGSEKFLEILGNSRGCGASPIESRKKKVESGEQKVESKASEVEDRSGVFANNDVWAKWGEFKEHRREQKHPMTPQSIKNSMETIREHSQGNPKIAVEMLRKAMARGWRGIFPLEPQDLDRIHKEALSQPKTYICEHCSQGVLESKRYDHQKEGVCPGWVSGKPETIRGVESALSALGSKFRVG